MKKVFDVFDDIVNDDRYGTITYHVEIHFFPVVTKKDERTRFYCVLLITLRSQHPFMS